MEEEIIIPEEETFDYDKLRYILDKDGYVIHVSLGSLIICDLGECTEYNGEVPEEYENIKDWYDGELEKLNAWKIVDGNLVFDVAKYEELKAQWEAEEKANRLVKYNEIYEMESDIENLKAINQEQYGTSNRSGKVISIANALQTIPYIKLTNIDAYKTNIIKLIINGKNILPNEATSQTINGITFEQNTDRTITIYGKAETDIEYNIAGASSNTSPILVLKKDTGYYLTSNGLTIKMYNFDGTDRTEVYSGSDGAIKFTDTDKEITHITLSIPSGTELDLTLLPQLEVSSTPTEYEMYKVMSETIDFTSYLEEPLYPSETLFPSEELVSSGTIIDYVLINENKIYLSINGYEEELRETSIILNTNNNTLYGMQDFDVLIQYKTTELNVESLEFLQGKSTTNNNFKILEDGSIEAHNGYFSGDIYLNDGGKILGGDGLLTSIIIPSSINSKMFMGSPNMLPMGYSLAYTNSSGTPVTSKDSLNFEFTIPKGFVIQSAYIILNHVPVVYAEAGTTKYTGYSRNLKLYRSTSYSTGKMKFDYAYSLIKYNNISFSEVAGAFGSSGFTGSSSAYKTAKSINLKNYIKRSATADTYNILKIETGNSTVSTKAAMYKQTGAVNGTLVIMGYTKFE